MKKISKKTREQAAMICAISASNEWLDAPEFGGRPPRPGTSVAVDLAWKAHAVAYAAWNNFVDGWTPHAPWAEAESLLRTGWVP